MRYIQEKTALILQESIPVVQGNNAFQNKEDAKACGKLVVDKLKKM
jgi:hypothetical protein